METRLKRFLSLALAIMMVFSMMPQITLGASAASGDTTVYLKPDSSIWATDGAWFAAYYWNDSTNGWVKMTDGDGDGYYAATIPAGYTNIIFTRNDPQKTDLSWESRWNQTADLTISGTNNLYTITGWNGSQGAGEWSHKHIAGAAATCVAAQTCTVCGEELNPATNEHDFSNNAEYCAYGCGEKNPDYVAPTEPLYTVDSDDVLATVVVAMTANGNGWTCEFTEVELAVGTYPIGIRNENSDDPKAWIAQCDLVIETAGTYKVTVNFDGTNASVTSELITASEPAISGTFNGALINKEDAERTFISAELKDVYAKESVVLKLFDAQDTLLATTSLVDHGDILGNEFGTLSMMIGINCTDSYWDTKWEDGKLRADFVPAYATLYIDGTEMNTKEINMSTTSGEYAVVWGEVPGVPAVPVNYVAYIGEQGFESLVEAAEYAQQQENPAEVEIKVSADISEPLSGKTLYGKIVTDNPAGVTITDSVNDNYVNAVSLTIGAGVTLNAKYFYFYSGEYVVEGTLKSDTTLYISENVDVIVRNGGKIECHTLMHRLNTEADAGIYIYGDNSNDTVEVTINNYLANYSGIFYAKDAIVNAGYILLTANVDEAEYAAAYMELDNTIVTIVGASNTSDRVNMNGDVVLTLKNGSKIADVRDMDIASGINLTLNVDETSSIHVQYPVIAEDVPFKKVDNGDGTYGIAEVTKEISGNLGTVYVQAANTTGNNTDRNRLYGEIKNVYAKESVVVKVYSGETLISTTNLTDKYTFPYEAATLGVNVVISGSTSSSWNTVWEEGMPRADLVPDKAVLYIDGTEMDTATVTLNGIDNLGTPTVWETLPGVNPDPNAPVIYEVSTKAELDAALAAAKDGDTIKLLADIDCGSAGLKIEDAITLDLGGKTLTTSGRNYSLSLHNDGIIVTNGKLVHAGTVAAIKVYSAAEISNLDIDVTGTSSSGNAIGGIVIQQNSAGVDTIKNVNIYSTAGQGIANGIETHNCGNATEPVIGSMENVTVNAKGNALNISAPVGTAKNCSFTGGESGIEIWIKGTYSATLDLVDCDVVGGVYAHDEGNETYNNDGTLKLTVDSATTGASAEDVTLSLAVAENVEGVLADVKDNAVAKVGYTYYLTLADAVAAAEPGATITIIADGEYELPIFADKELTFVGASKTGVIINDAPDANTQGWLNTTFHFENLTLKGAAANYHGLANGVVAVTYKECVVNGLRFLYAPTVSFENCEFNANGVEHSFWTYGASNVTVTGCTFNYTDRAVNCYSENGEEHETDITFTNCTFNYTGTADAPEGAVEINSGNSKSIDLVMNGCTAPAKGDMWFISQWDNKGGANTTVYVDSVKVWPEPVYVAQIGDTKFESFADAVNAAVDGDTIELISGENVISLAGNVAGGKTVTITGTAIVDWTKGNLMVGRGGEGDGKVIFDGANITSSVKKNPASTGIHVSGSKASDNTVNNGVLVIKNSTIELDYLINRNETVVEGNSNLTVYGGCYTHGRDEGESGITGGATANLTIEAGSTVTVVNENGMGVGGEGNGIMTVKGTYNANVLHISSIGAVNVEGGNLNIDGTVTNSNIIQVTGESTLNIPTLSGTELNLLHGAVIKDSTVGGEAMLYGNVTFRGDNTFAMLYDYGNAYSTEYAAWTVEKGASVTLTEKARYGLGYGDKVTIYGNLEDALTARENLTAEDASLFTHGLVAMSNWDVNNSLTVKNAYVIIGSNNSFGNSPKSGHVGTFEFNFENTVLDASRITFYKAASKTNFNFNGSDVKVGTFMTRDDDSIFTLTNTKLVSTTTFNGTDEGNYHAGELVLNNSSLSYAAPLVMENGTLTLGAGSSLTAPSISGTGKLIIDATGMTAGTVATIDADASGFTGAIEVINSDMTAEIDENGNIVLVAPVYVAQIGETLYESLADAAKDIATDGSDTTIKILCDIEVPDSIVFNYGSGNVIFEADEPVTIKQTAAGKDFDFTVGKTNQIIIGKNVTFEIYDNAGGLYVYYGPSLVLDGTITGGQNWGVAYLYDGSHVVSETGKLGTGRIQIGGDADLTVKGEVDTNYLLVEGSAFTADGATVDATVIYDNNNGGQRWGASTFDIKNDSTVTTSKLTLSYADTVLTIDGTSSITAGTIEGTGKIVIDATNLTAGPAPISGDASGFTGTIEVVGNDELYAAIDENGNIVLIQKVFVAQIGETKYETFEAAIAAACADSTITRIDILCDYTQDTIAVPGETYTMLAGQNLTIGADKAVTVTLSRTAGESFSIYLYEGNSSLTIEENVTIEGLDIVANGFATSGNNTTINGNIKALSLKQWTSNGEIVINGKVELGYGDGQFDLAYGNGTVTVNGKGDKTAPQFKAGYSGSRGNGNTLNLNNTYFESGAWFTLNGSNVTVNLNNSLLAVSGGDAAGCLTIGAGNVVNVGAGSEIKAGTINGAGKIVIDAAGMTAGEVTIITGTVADTLTVEVINNDALEASIVDGKIILTEKKAVAKIGDTTYPSLQAAIDKAEKDDVVVLLEDLNIADVELSTLDGKYNTLFKVAGKKITVDLNEKTISGAYSGTDMLVGVFSTEDDGHLTLTGNGTINVTATNTVYALLVNYDETSTLTVENGTYTLDAASDSLVYSGSDETATINGGTYTLGNVGTGKNGSPWIFNAKGQNTANIIVNAGTFNADIFHQYYPFEVLENRELALKNNGDGTWTIVDAVAYVGETEGAYIHEVGYATLEEAVAAADVGGEVTILKAGTYNVPAGKDLIITGAVDGVVFDNIGAKNMGGANVTFNNVTFNYASDSTYKGLQHSGDLVYNNCTINGQVFLYGTSETFNNCTFNTTDAANYNVWTYGAKEVAFNECTFNCAGKSVLVYNEGADHSTDLTVTDCDFIASAPVEGKAAIEIDTSPNTNGKSTVVIDGKTTVTGFATGSVSGETLWNDKKNQANIDVYVDNVQVWPKRVAAIGETYYSSLQAAIDKAVKGDTIILLADITENVTLNKSVTIDGADKNYTGNISVSGSTTAATVKNVNFIGGDGYAITTNRIKSITVENCTATGYSYGFLYANKSTPTVVVKDVEVSDVNYGFHWVYGTTATLENVKMTNVAYGIMVQNHAAKTVTLTGCEISGTNPIYVWEKATATQTFNFIGENKLTDTDAETAISTYAKLVLAEETATLAAAEGLNVTTSVADRKVVYEDGIYSVKEMSYGMVAMIGETYFETVDAAIKAAVAGDTMVLVNDAQETALVMLNGIDLDLAGHNLTVESHVAAFAGNNIIDTVGGGLLKVQNNVLIQDTNTYLPIWDAVNGGYAFAGKPAIDVLQTNPTDSSVKYTFLPYLDIEEYALLAQGIETSGVTLKVRVSWTSSNGMSSETNFKFTDDLMQAFYNSYNPETGKFGQAFTLTLNGTDSVSDLAFQVYFESDLGVVLTCN